MGQHTSYLLSMSTRLYPLLRGRQYTPTLQPPQQAPWIDVCQFKFMANLLVSILRVLSSVINLNSSALELDFLIMPTQWVLVASILISSCRNESPQLTLCTVCTRSVCREEWFGPGARAGVFWDFYGNERVVLAFRYKLAGCFENSQMQ